LIKLIIQ